MSPDEKRWLVGIDLGAGSLKVTVVGNQGSIGASASRQIHTSIPRPGWSEQDPWDWWLALCAAAPEAMANAGVGCNEVAGISFSAGAHTAVLTDDNGQPLRAAILWNDQRSGVEAEMLNRAAGDEILQIGLNCATPTWTLPQLYWLRRNEPELTCRVERVYVAKDWLRGRLTGAWQTDTTDAVSTLLFDPAKSEWSDRLCELAEWNAVTLPPVVQPSRVVGEVTRDAAAKSGFAAGTPVVCGTSDTSIEAFAAGAVEPGMGTVKLATAGTICLVGEQPNVHASLINYPFAIPGLWYTISGTNGCASAHRWLRDRVFMHPGTDGESGYAEMDRLAGETKAGADGLLFHPYLQGERAPYWDPFLRADFVGLTQNHDRGHLVRALYEGIAFSLRDVLGAFKQQGLELPEARIIGGGAKSAIWRQIISDVLGIPILLPANTDASYGAALLAGVGVGVFENERAAGRLCLATDDRHEPSPNRSETYSELFEIYKDTQERLEEIDHRLHAFVTKGDDNG